LVCRESSFADPAADDKHTNWLEQDHRDREQNDVHRPVLIPMPAPLAHPLTGPIAELYNVGHKHQHDRNLNAVEEIHEPPVDIARCNCEHCTNEDRPASAPDEGWHCSTEGTDGHTEGLVLVRIDDPSFHHFLCRRRVLGSSVAVRAIILVVNEGSLHFWVLGKV